MNNLINILSVSFALFVIYQALNAQSLFKKILEN